MATVFPDSDDELKDRARMLALLPKREREVSRQRLLHAVMVICGGSSTKYYWCGDSRKRGTCSNKTSLREDIARTRILSALRDRFGSPKAVTYLRQRIAEELGKANRGANAELEERRARLARTEERLRRLVDFLANGNASESVADAIKDLEVQARAERATIKATIDASYKPVRLPTPDDLLARARELNEVLSSDPTRGREALRRLFEGGQIKVTPQPGGTYVAESTLLPMMLFAPDAQNAAPPTGTGRGRSFTALSCAGAQLDFTTTKNADESRLWMPLAMAV
jgi:hypothetical protein